MEFPLHNSSPSSYIIQLIYEKLPKDISERHVLLMDPVLATGDLCYCLHAFILFHLSSIENYSNLLLSKIKS